MLEPGGTQGAERGNKRWGQKPNPWRKQTCDSPVRQRARIRLSPESGDWLSGKEQRWKALVQFQMNRKYRSVTKGRIRSICTNDNQPCIPTQDWRQFSWKDPIVRLLQSWGYKMSGWGNFRSALRRGWAWRRERRRGKKTQHWKKTRKSMVTDKSLQSKLRKCDTETDAPEGPEK